MLAITNTQLKRALRQASCYQKWREAARVYDEHNGLDHWRKGDQTGQYDYVSIRQRLDHLRRLKARHDHRGLLYTLNEGIHGNLDGMGRAGLYGVNHFVVSQTNPHVVPFVTDGRRKQNTLGLLTETGRRTAREWFNTATILADRADRKNGAVTRATSLMRSIVNQDYVGDINILPQYRFFNPLKLLKFPGEKQMQRLVESGERCTWPKLEMIRQQTLISRTLDGVLAQYDANA